MKENEKEEFFERITKYIDECLGYEIDIDNDSRKKTISHSDIYDLLLHIHQYSKKRKLFIDFDYSISSSSISKSIQKQSSKEPQTSDLVDFALLEFLVKQSDIWKNERDDTRTSYRSAKLVGIIERFVESNKENLTYKDVARTRTGNTRVKTTVRFALNNLRNYQLIHRYDSHPRHGTVRSLRPSLFGLFMLIFLKDAKGLDSSIGVKSTFGQYLNTIKNKGELRTQLLGLSIRRFANHGDMSLLATKYLDIVLDALVITRDSLKLDEKKLSKGLYELAASSKHLSDDDLWDLAYKAVNLEMESA